MESIPQNASVEYNPSFIRKNIKKKVGQSAPPIMFTFAIETKVRKIEIVKRIDPIMHKTILMFFLSIKTPL